MFYSIHRFYALILGLAGLVGGVLTFIGYVAGDATTLLRAAIGLVCITVGYVFLRIALSRPEPGGQKYDDSFE